jgi:Ca2+-binding RTX toxin-like protein
MKFAECCGLESNKAFKNRRPLIFFNGSSGCDSHSVFLAIQTPDQGFHRMTINDKISRMLRRMTAGSVDSTAKRRQRSTPYRVEQLEQRQMLTTIDLTALSVAQGSTIFGAEFGDFSGYSVSGAGDVNGDGFDDLLIGAPFAEASGNAKNLAGDTYVIFGGPSLPSTMDLVSLGTVGVTIFGADAEDRSGHSVSSAGDVNGDGFDDLLIGAPYAGTSGNLKSNAGESYVIFGGASLPSTINLGSLGTAGVTIFGADEYDKSGRSVSSAGDVNGDGFDDLLIGAPDADASGNLKSNAGESYVIFGGASLPSTINLGSLGTAGVTIFGVDQGDNSGRSVSSAGDVNGDGFDDLLIGAPGAGASGNAKNGAGESSVIFGGASLPSTINLGSLGTAGVTIFGADQGDLSGHSVSSAGDVNGDGFDDLIIGAPDADASGNLKSNAGKSYVIFGGASLPSTINLGSLGTAGVTIFGADQGDNSGRSVSSAGDVNGDGFDDLLIGAPGASASGNVKHGAGESSLIFGAAALPSTINLGSLGTAGVAIFGADEGDLSGHAVSSAGDVNGDGFDDLIIGAPDADASGNATNGAGESYVIFGSNLTLAITNQGTAAANTLTGTLSPNIMNGGRGNDTLIGNGGADVLTGGQGNDILAVNDMSFKRVAGGTGTDTLRLDGSGLSLNLTTLKDNRLLGIEQIDIAGSGNNTLTLSLRDVLNLSDESNTVKIRRNAGDVVNFGTGWTLSPQQVVVDNVSFEVLTQGAARLFIQVPVVIVVNGTENNDAFVLTYSSTATNGTVTVMRSTDGGAAVNLGAFSMTAQVTLKGMAGTDSVRVVGTAGSDKYVVSSGGLTTNGAGVVLDSVETSALAGAAGDDLYQFDADTALGLYTLDESGGGSDTVDLSLTTTSGVAVNLGSATQQVVNSNLSLKLSSVTVFEKAVGGSGNDTLTGNSLANTLTGNAGNDRLNGGSGNDSLVGGLGDDTYVFGTATTAEADTVTEAASAGTDTLSFSTLTTNVLLNLGTTAVQTVHTNRTLKLNSASVFENIAGGSGNDTLTGNSLANILTGNSGNDKLTGGSGNDTYAFATATTAEADTVTEAASAGTDTLSFSTLTTDVILSLGTTADQTVHANRTLKLNSASVFENIAGGSGNDTLTGNSLANILVGNAGNDTLNGSGGRDILIGGLGLDTLNGGEDEDIVIAGRTTSDALFSNLNRVLVEWVSVNAYATRISNLRAGVGAPAVSFKAKVNVLNDAGEDDSLVGGNGTDWYFRALDDVVTGLVTGEVLDVL